MDTSFDMLALNEEDIRSYARDWLENKNYTRAELTGVSVDELMAAFDWNDMLHRINEDIYDYFAERVNELGYDTFCEFIDEDELAEALRERN